MIVCALASQSCLVPQSVDPIPDSPHPPPRFLLDSIPGYLLPPVLQLYRAGVADQSATPPCHCKLELSIPWIEEDDPTVSLTAKWFVDYDPNVPRLAAAVWTDPLDGSFDSPSTLRPLPGHEFDADALTISNGIHVVDVVLAETAAFDPASTTPNRGVKTSQGYTSAEHRFVINVQVDPLSALPSCPDVRPSVRVCQ